MSTRVVATVAREGKAQDVGSIRIHAGAGTTIMQLNDGRPNDLGEQLLFEVDMMTDQDVAAFPRGVQLENQAIGTDVSIKDRNKRFQSTATGSASSACSRERRRTPSSWRPSGATSG
jgi:hypothetical protein